MPGEGPVPARIALVGAYPGMEELRRGRPFAGQAGKELDVNLERNGFNRRDMYITNLLKTSVGDINEDDLDPDSSLIKLAARDLRAELRKVQPEIVMTLGALPAKALGIVHPLETCHGIAGVGTDPLLGAVLVPAYNPAAGIRNTRLMLPIMRDFEALRALADGTCKPVYTPESEKPCRPFYSELCEPGSVLNALDMEWSDVNEDRAIFIDTEGSAAEPWSIQFAFAPFRAWLIRATRKEAIGALAEWLRARRPLIVVHNSLHDLAVMRAMGIEIEGTADNPGFIDTMVWAFHLCDQPQGLKALAYRLAGMFMQDYTEVVSPAQEELSRDYLEAVYRLDWPEVKPETVWKRRDGKLEQRLTRPWQIKRHAEFILSRHHGMKPIDYRNDPVFGTPGTADLFESWSNVAHDKREAVEMVLGPMPEAGLQHIAFESAVQYACRDADATGRVYWKLKALHEERFP